MKKKRNPPPISVKLKGPAFHHCQELAEATGATLDQAANVLLSMGHDALENDGEHLDKYREFISQTKEAHRLQREANVRAAEAAAINRNARKKLAAATSDAGDILQDPATRELLSEQAAGGNVLAAELLAKGQAEATPATSADNKPARRRRTKAAAAE